MESEQLERERFEAWFIEGWSLGKTSASTMLERGEDGVYTVFSTKWKWEAWLARASTCKCEEYRELLARVVALYDDEQLCFVGGCEGEEEAYPSRGMEDLAEEIRSALSTQGDPQ